ncbi:import inner membrane translocase subunit tim44 [Rhizophagus irregularis]|uniref:Mitochondrial import inner membrane translocase subunit TIM44 n=2 Tax=Rhizophagus irregularis TaxID=588596 RepID=A0A2I1DU67_9GLOM|nr:import inner membrane translocase subunit tim44 [Rhizophagus irregularis DAOM 181602=DAOM 197198]PKC16931.1 import inner membrane translocase subunit tim44 [Rhizophagus irregularis]PKC76055.1 import inner membrane translocase subunit tim44 [Rhizophagus irregularis]PKK79377.1 import inner membrane translocase subunit tim44 [Rhizophagus irregularis]PKY13416.1 import inner membrane translocase subunit tim44 [Rhizophagus irregularis]POG63996.1 import inner membrane translocase subunit tim44 [Rh|eukprot:XP_025170862.1 import inner membrane translocase subunit tim44 [Rhizophagus irregularis DAOM 181602=DAOM 197198]
MIASRTLFTFSNVLRTRSRYLIQLKYRSTHARSYTSPVTKFFETINEEIKKNKELQQNVKLLQDQAGQLSESDALRKAKEAYIKAKEGAENTTTLGSEKLKKSMDEIKKSAEKVGSAVSDTFEKVNETPFVKESKEKISQFSDKVSTTTEPIRQTRVYTNIRDSLKETVGDDSMSYGGFVDKETRKKMKEQALSKSKSKVVEMNPEAGSSMVLHKDSAWKESWNKIKETNPIIQGIFNMKKSYEDSDNIFISYTRAFTSTLGSLFEENETAQVMTQMKMIDPRFNLEDFMREAREYIIPEIMEAYLKGDTTTLREWCSEATYNVLTHGIKAQIKQGLISDSRILDIRDVEFVTAKLLENLEIPVLVISFNTQEVIVFRDRLTNEIKYGSEDQIDQNTYGCVFTKQEDRLMDPVTNGWKMIDIAKNRSQRLLW